MSKIKKSHPKAVKFQAALEMIRGEKTVLQLSQQYSVHQSVLHRWKKELLTKGEMIFGSKSPEESSQVLVDGLQRKIGELTMELDFLKKYPLD